MHAVQEGCVQFDGAQKLRVLMDSRCSTDGDDYLRISLTQSQDATTSLASYSGRFGPPRASGDTSLVVPGDTLWYSFQGNHGSDWGFRFVVEPEYSDEKRMESLRQQETVVRFAADAMATRFGASEDAEIVRLVNDLNEEEGIDSLSLPPAAFSLPVGEENEGRYPLLEKLPIALVRLRFALLQNFNLLLSKSMLCHIDLTQRTQTGTLAHQLSLLRERIFFDVKARFFESVLGYTRSRHTEVPLVVIDRRANKPVFMQMFNRLFKAPVSRLKGQDMAFRVQFAGEGAEGDNGPYRECFSEACSDLESDRLELFVPCPNAIAGGKLPNQDTYVVRPSASLPADQEMFEFVGRLFGMAMRTGLPLDLHLSPVLWRMLVGDGFVLSAVQEFDAHAYRSLVQLLDSHGGASEAVGRMQETGAGESIGAHAEELSEANFNDRVCCSFEVVRSDGSVVPLCENGSSKKVTWESKGEYASLALCARLYEGKKQVGAISRGLGAMVPRGMMCLLGWRELERLVTGRDELDIKLLREHTVYRGVSQDDQLIVNLWEVLGGFGRRERASFLRFVWGRSRLPRASQFLETFKVHAMPGSGDGRLPKADTCFFTLHLPQYTSLAVLKERLLYAIKHCADMDLK